MSKRYIRNANCLDKIKAATQHFQSFVILGDSITDTWMGGRKSGGGASDAAHGYPQLLHQYLKTKFGEDLMFKNLGYGGSAVLAAFEVAKTELVGKNFDIIGIALGTNDWNLQNSLENFYAQYRELIGFIKENSNAPIFLISLGFFDNWQSQREIKESDYNEVIFRLADEFRLPVVDMYFAMTDYIKNNGVTFSDITYERDPVHPNDLGHQIWCDACKEIFD